jgi:hypothetical protein
MTSTTARCDQIVALIDACLADLGVASDAQSGTNESTEHAR